MQNKTKKIKFNKWDILVTKKGYELYPIEIIAKYYSKTKGHYVKFTVPVFFNQIENIQLKTIEQKDKYWSTVHTTIIDKIKFIKKPTCKLKRIS